MLIVSANKREMRTKSSSFLQFEFFQFFFSFSAALWHEKIALCLFRSRQGQTSLVCFFSISENTCSSSLSCLRKISFLLPKEDGGMFSFEILFAVTSLPGLAVRCPHRTLSLPPDSFLCGVSAKHDISRHSRFAMKLLQWPDVASKNVTESSSNGLCMSRIFVEQHLLDMVT